MTTDHLAVLEEIAEELRVFGDDLYQGGAALHGFADRITAAIALMRGQSEDEVLVALKRPEGYEDVHPELVAEDAIRPEWPSYRTITTPKDTADEQ